MSEFKDDMFLARWLNNELSDEELKTFQKSEEYAAYQRIKAGSELLNSSEFNEAELLAKIKQGRQIRQKVSMYSRKWWVYSAAASLLIVFSFAIYTLFFSWKLTTYQTAVGEKRNVTLPDGSEVVLNANSTLSYSNIGWEDDRLVDLKGEGLFKVRKGERFTVQTSLGDVTVLGTEFTVQELDDYFEVKCFEGSVKVQSGKEEVILKPKKSVRKLGRERMIRKDIEATSPEWLKNKSSFKSVPVRYVLKSLQNYYEVRFEGMEKLGGQTVTVTIPHDNLDLALKVVFGSLDISYQRNENVVVIN